MTNKDFVNKKYWEVCVLSSPPVRGATVVPIDESEIGSERDYYNSLAIIPDQTHSLNVAIVNSRDQVLDDTDGLITFEENLPIGIRTADCVPILLYGPDISAIGAVHAGWKGTLGGIIDNVIDLMVSYGADPEKIIVAFGPSISKEIYEVDEQLAQKFIDAGFADFISYPEPKNGLPAEINNHPERDSEKQSPVKSDSKPHIDLQGINIERLIRKGVRPGNIRANHDCSYLSTNEDGNPLYPSHRRSGGSPSRMLTYITRHNQ